MSTHTIQTEVEVELADGDNAYPTIEITFDYEPGYTPRTPRGEYAPIDPPVGAELSFREAKLIKDLGLDPDPARVQRWGETFLDSEAGRVYAADCAELDLLAMRHAHLEDSREQ